MLDGRVPAGVGRGGGGVAGGRVGAGVAATGGSVGRGVGSPHGARGSGHCCGPGRRWTARIVAALATSPITRTPTKIAVRRPGEPLPAGRTDGAGYAAGGSPCQGGRGTVGGGGGGPGGIPAGRGAARRGAGRAG